MRKLALLGLALAAALASSCRRRAIAEDRCAKFRRETAESEGIPVDSLTFTEMQLDKAAQPTFDVSGSPHLDYVAGYHAPLLAEFFIDTTGTIVPSRFRPRHVGDSALVDATRKVLPQWIFTPAEVQGCKVNELVLFGINW